MPIDTPLAEVPWLVAELSYFRIPRTDWELLLLRMRQLGASIVATAVPWRWHAPTSERQDVSGTTHPQRDVAAFVRLCARLGLRVILRLGPFVDESLLGGGLPSWLPNDDGPSLNGLSLRHTSAWFAALSAVLRPLEAPFGPIIALEIDSGPFDGRVAETLTATLRDAGWRVPVGSSAAAMPWTSGLLQLDVTDSAAFVAYVAHAHWRPKVARGLVSRSPMSVLAATHAAQDFAFAAPFLGGCDGVHLVSSVQSLHESPSLAAAARWGMEAPVRPDGSVRARFWHAKGPLTLLDAAGVDFTHSRVPADIAVGFSLGHPQGTALPMAAIADASEVGSHMAHSQRLAQRLVASGASFAVVDLDVAPLDTLRSYPLLLVPAAPPLLAPTQAALAELAQVRFVGDTFFESAEELETLAATGGGHSRYAWADQPDIDVLVRYSVAAVAHPLVYLWMANRRQQPYTGMIAYRAPDGSIEHVHVSLGPLRVGLLILRAGDLLGAALGGDSTEGSWLVRGLRTSIVWSGGPAVVAPYDLGAAGEGQVLFVSSPTSGRLNLRRPEGWERLVAYRLLFDGALVPVVCATEQTHLSVPYVAEDELGQTDGYLLCLADAPLPERLRAYLNTLLQSRSALLERSADTLARCASSPLDEAQVFAAAAVPLVLLANGAYTAQQYGTTLARAAALIQPALDRLAMLLAAVRLEHANGAASASSRQLHDALQQVVTAF